MTGAQLIADIRDLIGDPTYDANGVPQPALDGQFLKAQTVVRWINQAQNIITIALKCVEDWTAFPSVINQDIYSIDPRFFDLESGILIYDGFETSGPPQIGESDILPYQNLVTGTTLGWAISRTVPPLRIRFWPAPDRTPGSSTLSFPITPTATSLIVANSASFGVPHAPNYGWLRVTSAIGVELIRYQLFNSTTRTFSVLSRGEGGSKGIAHLAGDLVEEANVWVKGKRIPTPLGIPTLSQSGQSPVLTDTGYMVGSYQLSLTDVLEIPDYVSHIITNWCVHRARTKENDDQSAGAMLKSMVEEIKLTSGARRRQRIGQAKPFGSGSGGGLWQGRWIIP